MHAFLGNGEHDKLCGCQDGTEIFVNRGSSSSSGFCKLIAYGDEFRMHNLVASVSATIFVI